MEQEEITVSVIILTYNHKKYIRQALDSVLMQKTLFRYEILVGDDASTDGTSEIVRQYAKRYPHCIRAFIREENLKGTKNLYDLFLRARGKYIASCEGDDYWCSPHKLQHQVAFLESHPDYSGCTHDCLVVDEKGAALPDQVLPWVCLKEEYTLADFKGVYLPGQAATLTHRNFFRNAEHDYSIIYKADTMIADRTIILILAAQGKLRRFPEVMSCYRVRTYTGAQNATSVLFRNNLNVNRMQYELTCKLEQYMHEEFGIKIHFTKFKCEQRLKGWIKGLLGALWRNKML